MRRKTARENINGDNNFPEIWYNYNKSRLEAAGNFETSSLKGGGIA